MHRSTLAPAVCLLLGLPAAHAQSGAPEDVDTADLGGPRWEGGLAAGSGRVADYPGADQSHLRGLVAPVVVYRGPTLRVDSGGVRGRVFDSPDWQLDVTGTAAFNARNNDARAGMPDLDYLFGLGPKLVYRGWHGGGAPTLHLNLRAVFSTDFHRIDLRGATFGPELRWRLPLAHAASSLVLSVQPAWATRALQRYFYQVDPAQATATRPAYEARAGYLGTGLGATWTRRESDTLSWFFGARVESLHGAANAGSPLLRSRTNLNVGAGVVWLPWRSREPGAAR
jgi:hypothetical protein